jgi:hypothetical protein
MYSTAQQQQLQHPQPPPPTPILGVQQPIVGQFPNQQQLLQQQQQDDDEPVFPTLFIEEKNIATQFGGLYYNTFDTNRAALGRFFRDASTISFEGDNLIGSNAFLNKLQNLGIPNGAQHRVVTVDAQPSIAGGGSLIVFVTGDYVQQQFSEVMQLVPDGTGNGYYVHNLIFRVGNANAFNVPQPAREVGKGFIEYYYRTYDSDRQSLIQLYRPHSNLTYEDQTRQGQAPILHKLQTLPAVLHDAQSITADVQQVNGNAMLLIFVTGRLSIEGSNPLFFSETFMLVQEGNSYYIANHIFKLKYG